MKRTVPLPAVPGVLLLLTVALLGPAHASRPTAPAKNVILFVGDGMGVAVITAARIERGSRQGLDNPADGRLRLDAAPHVSLVRTASADRLVTDSAAAITALVSGARVPNGVLNCLEHSGRAPDTLTTIGEVAHGLGMSVGIVTNTGVTHATPAGVYAHDPDRGREFDIAAALVPGTGNPRFGAGIEVILGGGRNQFAAGTHGRPDGRDLRRELKRAGYSVVSTKGELAAAAGTSPRRLIGLFAPSHMTYVLDRAADSSEPSLSAMTAAAIRLLSRNPNGYFLLVEGGRIDHALHETNAHRAVAEMLDFDDTVAGTLDAIGDDTLVLVTADHDHTMVLAGYPDVKGGVFSQAGVDENGVPYTTLLFATGKTDAAPRTLTPDQLADKNFHERAGVPGPETHGGMDVPLYAWGPAGVLDRIPGTLDNTEIFTIMLEALGGPVSASPPEPAHR